MRVSTKLVLAFLGVTAVVLAATLGLARWSFERGFLDYVNALEQTRLERLASSLASQYQADGESWNSLTNRRFGDLMRNDTSARELSRRPPATRGDRGAERRPPPRDRMGGPSDSRRPPRGQASGNIPAATVLLDAQGDYVAGVREFNEANPIRVAIALNDRKIGELNSAPKRHFETAPETAFSRQQYTTSLLIALVSVLLATVVSYLVARRLLAPVKRMAEGVSLMSSGDYKVRLSGERKDELGQLMADLNHLAFKLDEAQSARQRWFADISHELRTPTAVLMGELEAIKDGIRPMNLEQMESMAQEVARLRTLIDDLYQLSVSEVGGLRYNMQSLSLSDALSDAVGMLEDRAESKGIILETELDEQAEIEADPQRLRQLLDNLLNNSLAYTDAPGRLRITLKRDSNHALVSLEDSAPGISAVEGERLFEPLYRQEQSRNRRTAGAGLGLAICRNIAKAHRGEISASPSELGGVKIELRLPLKD
ncbi:ATP-binding protein [Paraferrimonas sedimenticola]|uniref:histidine kinase n=2 Tax=Paraferrimonas sedimenticola TaxID=375674 RepID=A0AA37RUZ8_9GAMM|nr:ATP-binding protein [Paraferrimonas sedimenticola]GLP95354.1 two-component sensor histidine kinase [Paraferrimonas sedimenticola]